MGYTSSPFTGLLIYLVTVDVLAVQNGIETTVVPHDTLLQNNKNVWVQLAGHPGESTDLLTLQCL